MSNDYNKRPFSLRMIEEFQKLHQRFPFLTYGKYLDEEYIGIIQNTDQQFVSMYIYNKIQNTELKEKFLELGETWWWESNRKIPINMFLGEECKVISPFLMIFIQKEFQHIEGPTVCLDNMMEKRIKRRRVQLVRKIS